jgi:hypothetical protein
MPLIVQTPRLILRELELSDLAALTALRGDERVMRFSYAGPQTPRQVEEYLRQCIQRYNDWGYGLWAVTLTGPAARFIGVCGLMRAPFDDRWEPELGYRLAPDCWGRGYATEAAAAARDMAFERFGLRTLVALIDPANAASIRVAEKIGLRFERALVHKGQPMRLHRQNAP